jgi:hypothetical protein
MRILTPVCVESCSSLSEQYFQASAKVLSVGLAKYELTGLVSASKIAVHSNANISKVTLFILTPECFNLYSSISYCIKLILFCKELL